MAAGSPAQANPPDAAAFAEAHRKLIADTSIQFDLPAATLPEIPQWMLALPKLLAEIFPALRVVFWVVVAALALFLLFVLVRRLSGSRWPWRKRSPDDEANDWRPEEAPARALLGEADALAAQGRFGEAAHLLLFKSIEEIETRRPAFLRPAFTSRDIASAASTIPAGPRSAFGAIAMLVERSLFGGRTLAEPDWQQCRAAYEEFAFAEAWR